ncbi:hypothetical protein KKF84_14245 [Myxococcota bacterium]|nr:hypothetical protein [Myxococcota bacterium]
MTEKPEKSIIEEFFRDLDYEHFYKYLAYENMDGAHFLNEELLEDERDDSTPDDERHEDPVALIAEAYEMALEQAENEWRESFEEQWSEFFWSAESLLADGGYIETLAELEDMEAPIDEVHTYGAYDQFLFEKLMDQEYQWTLREEVAEHAEAIREERDGS